MLFNASGPANRLSVGAPSAKMIVLIEEDVSVGDAAFVGGKLDPFQSDQFDRWNQNFSGMEHALHNTRADEDPVLPADDQIPLRQVWLNRTRLYANRQKLASEASSAREIVLAPIQRIF